MSESDLYKQAIANNSKDASGLDPNLFQAHDIHPTLSMDRVCFSHKPGDSEFVVMTDHEKTNEYRESASHYEHGHPAEFHSTVYELSKPKSQCVLHVAKPESLRKAFGTDDNDEVVSQILSQGTVKRSQSRVELGEEPVDKETDNYIKRVRSLWPNAPTVSETMTN